MIEFLTHECCDLCSLCDSADNRGIPTRPLFDRAQAKTKDVAILFLGQSPGHLENKRGVSFQGYTGGLLNNMIKMSGITDYADVFLANALRCRPPQGANETQSQIRACRAYLVEDLKEIQKEYDEVIVVALGAKACYSAAKITSIKEAMKKQGSVSAVFEEAGLGDIVLFFTNHPAILHPQRQPALARVVQSHFELIVRYLKKDFIPNSLVINPEIGIPTPKKLEKYISIDIETYGILKGVEQTVFNPHKMKWVDGIPYKDQIVTIGFGWIDPEQGMFKPKTYTYRWDCPLHRRYIRQWFRRMAKQNCIAIGQNFKFDMLCLAHADDPELTYWVSPLRLQVDDTLILGFLLFEQQPEKGLKELATLFGIYDYSLLEVTGKSGTAHSSKDSRLHLYQAADVAVTIVLYMEVLRRIEDRYGKDSPKLSGECAKARNMVLWDVFDLEGNGSTFQVDRLTKFHNKLDGQCNRILKAIEASAGFPFSGKGSDAPTREFMYECAAEAGLLGDSRLAFSVKTKKISIGVENVNLVMDHLPQGPHYRTMQLFQKAKQKGKIVSTYTKPILTMPRKGIVRRVGNRGMIYPS